MWWKKHKYVKTGKDTDVCRVLTIAADPRVLDCNGAAVSLWVNGADGELSSSGFSSFCRQHHNTMTLYARQSVRVGNRKFVTTYKSVDPESGDHQGQRSGLAEWLMTNTWVTVSKKCGQIFTTDFRHSNRTEITFHIYTAVNISGLCLRLHLYWWSKQKPTPLLVLCQMPFQLQYNPTNLSWVDRGTESRWSAYPTTWS